MVTDTLEAIIAKVVDTSKADYAVITGIEIHTGNNVSGRYVQLRYFVNTQTCSMQFPNRLALFAMLLLFAAI